MRIDPTNVPTTRSATPAAGPTRSHHAFALLAACGIAVTGLCAAPSHTASAADWLPSPAAEFGLVSSAPAECRRVEEIEPRLFPRSITAAYDFTGANAERLRLVIDAMTDQVSPTAILVHLVLVPDTDDAFAFQFGPDGCHTGTLPLNFSEMRKVFDRAGVAAPFGATYYQMPRRSI